METFPAVLIGGPPHSGKSVLTYSLTQALRERHIDHYVLRAAPDGEGDWAAESAQKLVRAIRYKGPFGDDFVDFICQSLQGRHLPLLVDVGGRPTPYQEQVFDYCTHAILLTPDQASRDEWAERVERHGLVPLADLHSELRGTNVLSDAGAVLRGTMSGLERGTTASGVVFDALVERLAGLFAYDPQELRQAHTAMAPVETVIELKRVARALGVDPHAWEPQDIPQVLDYLPEASPLAIYDRAPIWLYAAIALHVHPAALYQFDIRLGWVRPAELHLGEPAADAPLAAQVHPRPDHVRIELRLPQAYLDYREGQGLFVPVPDWERGVVLSGKLPQWLWTGLALAYREAPWLAVFQPQLGLQPVVVYSQVPELQPGMQVASEVVE
ncbi:MAG: hypothetical protein JXA37_05885 [Chloroflexia bacterium]|nr:hypothetical protein [Chloroflexia bacterium]